MRKRVSDNLSISPQAFVHETAIIDDSVNIGAGTKIWHFSHVLPDSEIGEPCTIGKNVEIGLGVTIGKSCKIQNNVSVFKGVTLEDGVFCGPSMVFLPTSLIPTPKSGKWMRNELLIHDESDSSQTLRRDKIL
jgi:UDP-3-O-[3-hydroxymyristoyl] glucosamine N-acyltransferase